MPKSLKKLALFARKDGEDVVDILNNLKQLLSDYELAWETQTAKLADCKKAATVHYDELGKDSDLIIVVGGDGSMLRATRAAMKYQTPVIGINKGRLGFLTDIRPNELTTRLQAVLEGKYWIAERFLLQTTINFPNKKQRDAGTALNDIILYPGKTPHMLEFEVFVDNQFLCSHRADGFIIATPTGSTAYNLSAGGPIIQPNVDALVMLPMFSHSLTARPIIIPAKSQIRIEFSEKNDTEGKLSCNAGEIIDITPGTAIQVKKAEQTIQLLHPLDYDYYESLRSKLYWGHKLT